MTLKEIKDSLLLPGAESYPIYDALKRYIETLDKAGITTDEALHYQYKLIRTGKSKHLLHVKNIIMYFVEVLLPTPSTPPQETPQVVN